MKSHFPPFGPILRQFRQAKELSQEELAALLDISPSYISRLESDSKKPSLEMIFRLAGALKVNPHELIKAMEN
ncbi:helix-turn-helix domain-containing protein [uncultured Desulfovibrio sp.]|uniref:helix-turn-helix domain-containing protein n=1 Tax=uncultured Desulfovibrio sp. TaxID=167968 RepID=UPI00272986A8|nr:helix-turn-helix transcriptional regulator [uncultured Desulfovibrio sp.]